MTRPAKPGHGHIAAAFRDHVTDMMAVRQIRVKAVVLQKLGQIHTAGKERGLDGGGAKEEASRVRHLGIKIREDGVDWLLYIAAASRVYKVANGELVIFAKWVRRFSRARCNGCDGPQNRSPGKRLRRRLWLDITGVY